MILWLLAIGAGLFIVASYTWLIYCAGRAHFFEVFDDLWREWKRKA